MKILRIIIVGAIATVVAYVHTYELYHRPIASQSFMFTRPAYQSLFMQQSGWHNVVINNPIFAFQVIPYYQQTINKRETAYYFSPCTKTNFSVVGDDYVQDKFARNIRAEWLGLPSDFKGIFSLSPQQKQFGAYLEFNANIDHFCSVGLWHDSWIDIQLPIGAVFNDLRLCDDTIVTSTNAGGPLTIAQAMAQPAWHFSKIGGERKKGGPAVINVLIGKSYLNRDLFQMDYYSGLSIPTAGKQDPEWLFAPFLGNNRHVGLVVGMDTQLHLNSDDQCAAFCFYADLELFWLIRNWQYRTFDLVNKPWSRYLQFVKKNAPAGEYIPGVNVLTRKVKVRPYGMVDFAMGFRLKRGCAEGELGFSIWGHDREHIIICDSSGCPPSCSSCPPGCIACPDCVYGIAGVGAVEQAGFPPTAATASKSTIGYQAATDVDTAGNPTFVRIYNSDLELNSGASQGAVVYRIHAAITIASERDDHCFKPLMNIGGFAELPRGNTALPQWGVWLKVDGSF